MIQLSRRGVLAGAAAAACAAPARAAGATIIAVGADPAYTPFYLAAHEKMFAAAGLDVALQIYADGGETLNSLVAGQVNLACGAEPTTMIRIARGDIRPLAVFEQSGSYIKCVAGKSVPDLASIRRWAVVPGTVSEYSAGLAMRKAGVDPKSVTIVKSAPPELPALLARGDVDGYFAWEPWPTMGVRQGGHVLTTSGEVGYTYTLWLTAAGPWLDGNAPTAQAILDVIARSAAITQAEPQRAAVAVQAVAKIPQAQTLELLRDLQCGVRDFTPADYASFDGIADFLAEQKITATRVDYRRALQAGFYKG